VNSYVTKGFCDENEEHFSSLTEVSSSAENLPVVYQMMVINLWVL
jgi:hypothetical protein